MALMKLFGAKPQEKVDMIPILTEEPNVIENEDKAPLEDEKDDTKRIITITWGTGMPIDVIFNFIHKNFEEEGFQDALVNSDVSYCEAKERIIRNDMEMLFKRIILRYKKNIKEIDVKIENALKILALGAVSRLQAQRQIYEEHLSEISEMQTLLDNNDSKMLTMIDSYRRGFVKGVNAESINFIDNI
jgi:hypothetical protein